MILFSYSNINIKHKLIIPMCNTHYIKVFFKIRFYKTTYNAKMNAITFINRNNF